MINVRDELILSNEALGVDGSILGRVLILSGFDISVSYVLNWIPEQSSDIYHVYMGGGCVVIVEIDRFGSFNYDVDVMNLNDYSYSCGKLINKKIHELNSITGRK